MISRPLTVGQVVYLARENTTAEPTPATVVSVARKWATLDHGGLKRRAEKDTGYVICPAWGLTHEAWESLEAWQAERRHAGAWHRLRRALNVHPLPDRPTLENIEQAAALLGVDIRPKSS